MRGFRIGTAKERRGERERSHNDSIYRLLAAWLMADRIGRIVTNSGAGIADRIRDIQIGKRASSTGQQESLLDSV